LGLRTVDYDVIDELQDERPQDFKTHGLRNLVRKIGDYVQRFGGSQYVTIDATGGYKAQIAIAVLMGQALDIPVFYKHERFPEIIDFPPLPISFDYDILAENADLLTDFERGKAFSSS
jgi:CRISPR/Cas system-associated protein Csm6